jgi:hypothetical protein
MEKDLQNYSLIKKIWFFLLWFVINWGLAWLLVVFFVFLDEWLDDYIFWYGCSANSINTLHFILNLFIFWWVWYLLLKIKRFNYLNKNKYIKIWFYTWYLFILAALYIWWAFLFEPIDLCECWCS